MLICNEIACLVITYMSLVLSTSLLDVLDSPNECFSSRRVGRSGMS